MILGLEKRVEVLETELAEMRERIKQFENVMSTAFGLIEKRGNCSNKEKI